MLKTLKGLLNNLMQNTYLTNRGNLILYDNSGRMSQEKPANCKDYKTINYLSEKARNNNLKVYIKTKSIISFKKLVLYIMPSILTGSIGFTLCTSPTKDKEVDVYTKHIIEFDEENILREETDDTLYYKSAEEVLKEGYEELDLNALKGNATFFIGEGVDGIQIYFDIDEKDSWEYTYAYKEIFFPLENSKELGKITENYEKLLRGAIEIFCNEADVQSTYKDFAKSKLDNDLKDIRVLIELYDFFEMQTLPVKVNHFWRLFTLISLLTLNSFIFIVIKEPKTIEKHGERIPNEDYMPCSKIKVLKHIKERLLLDEDLEHAIHIFYADKQADAEFLQAEQERIMKIYDLLYQNDASYDILTSYEKKLIKKVLNKDVCFEEGIK